MSAHPMDNPVWHSLRTEQRNFAVGNEHALRYPNEIAPFIAIGVDDEQARGAAAEIVARGEAVYFISIAPSDLSDWEILARGSILQMMWGSSTTLPSDQTDIVELGASDATAMVELTTLAFPGFFRQRTHELGHYVGIKEGEQLVSMAGERMHATGYQEISGVCTHPQYVGRGYSAKLNAHMIRHIESRGVRPFLHVASSNTRAQSLYRHLGFVERAALSLWHVRRL